MEANRVSRLGADVWARLHREPARGESLLAREAFPDVSERLIAALDADGQRHLLVLLTHTEKGLDDALSRGICVKTRDLVLRGGQGRYLDICCNDSGGYEAFDVIGGEIATRLAAGRETAPDVVARVLAKWRRFWGMFPRHMLSREQQLGLFAEIWFLSIWLSPHDGSFAALKNWRGPFGSRHDFEWAHRSVEVKATTSTRGPVHRVNGFEQLIPPEQGRLLLFSLRLREEVGATNTLPSLIEGFRARLVSDAVAVGQFESALTQAGYSPVHENEYAKVSLRVVEEALFEVRDDFPRLTPAQLIEGVPHGVEAVEYEINLGGFGHLCIARSVSECTISWPLE
jgi:hypothetical protein